MEDGSVHDDNDIFIAACKTGTNISSIRKLVLLAQERELTVPPSNIHILVDALKTTYINALKSLKEALSKQEFSDETEVERDEDDDPVETSMEGESAGLILDALRLIATRCKSSSQP